MNNLHINLNELTNPSRVLKQTKSLANAGYFNKIFIVGLHKEGLKELEQIDNTRELKRFYLKTRKLSRNFFVQLIKYLEFSFRVFSYYKDKNIKIINVHTLGLLPLGVFLKFKYKAKLVYDAHELETETNGLRGF